MSRAVRWTLVAMALAVLAGHLPWLARTPDDIDAVNFVLGVREFDVTRHQPHPPGYPVYIALGKAVTTTLAHVPGAGPFLGGARVIPEAWVLALIAAVCAALATVPLFVLFRELEGDPRRALAATSLTLTAPLVWFGAGRPLSDVPGLSVALVAQALLVTAFRRDHPMSSLGQISSGPGRLRASGRLIVVGALVSGLAVGVRSQTLWLTAPLWIFVLVDRTGRDAAGAMLGAVMAFVVGIVAWAVPLLVVAGGTAPYFGALWLQAAEDFGGVEMVATGATVRELVFAARDSFVAPWGGSLLAAVMLLLAMVGLVAMLMRARGAVLLLAAMVVPYLAFHLAFHETATVRYALPLVPPIAYLAARGIHTLAARAILPVTLAASAACLVVAVPASTALARQGSPVFEAVADARAALQRPSGPSPVIVMHHGIAFALRGEPLPAERRSTMPRREWLQLVSYWQGGGRQPVWFFAESKRTDLAAIDHLSRRLVRAYRWPVASTTLLLGARPGEADWYEIRQPRWFLAEGWALTPELAGVGQQLGRSPGDGGITGYLQRASVSTRLMIGGRHVGRRDEPAARVTLAFDGRNLDSWVVSRQPGAFLRWLTLEPADLAGPGAYATLVVSAEAADGSARPVSIAVEQFDAQSTETMIAAYDRGWHELEYNPTTGRLWRWTGAAANLVLAGAERDVTLRVSGESPLRYFDAPSRVRVRAGARELASFEAGADFTHTVRVPSAALQASNGIVTIETNQTFVPDERSGNGDQRRLGLRIYEVKVE